MLSVVYPMVGLPFFIFSNKSLTIFFFTKLLCSTQRGYRRYRAYFWREVDRVQVPTKDGEEVAGFRGSAMITIFFARFIYGFIFFSLP
jgi:hypothetical protein